MFDEIRRAYDSGFNAAFNELKTANPYNDEPYHAVAEAWDNGLLDALARNPHYYNLADLFERAFGEEINQSWYNQFVKLSPVERADNVIQLVDYAKKRNA